MAYSAKTAQVQAQENLRQAWSDIASAQLKIAENTRLASAMSGSAGHHDSERDNYETLLAVSGIPIVNLFAIVLVPVAMIGMSHHKKKAEECKAIESACQNEIRQVSAQIPSLENSASNTTTVVAQLDSAISSCSVREATARTLTNNAKSLMDECSGITAGIGDAVDAISRIGESGASGWLLEGRQGAWDSRRYEALEALHNMLELLEKGDDLLEKETLEVLEKEVKTLKGADLDGRRRLLEEGHGDDDDDDF